MSFELEMTIPTKREAIENGLVVGLVIGGVILTKQELALPFSMWVAIMEIYKLSKFYRIWVGIVGN
jgi:hypothetical protein